jgi:LPXTG-motif cell wall-anchored protein
MHQLNRKRQRAAGLLAVMALAAWPAIAAASAASAQSSGNPWIAWAVGDNAVNVLSLQDGSTIDTVMAGGSGDRAIAITPDGTFAYLIDSGSNAITPIDTSDYSVGAVVPVTNATSLIDIAITPDGTRAYVLDDVDGVYPIDLTTTTPTPGALIPGTAGGDAIVLTPDGETLYLAPDTATTDVRIVDTASDTMGGTTIPIPAAANAARLMTITPDDNGTVYVTSDGVVTPIDTGTNTAGTAISGLPVGDVTAITFAPDWTLYVTIGTNLYPITNGAAGSPIDLTTQGATGNPTAISFSPDGWHVLVATSAAEKVVVNGGTVTGTDVHGPPPMSDLVVAPDQAPVAALTVDGATAPATFDASASTVAFGPIVDYAWDFGDGTTENTTTPTTTHTYAQPGDYTASVTLTSEGGTSTTKVYNGRMMVRNGGPQATATATAAVTISPQASSPAGLVLAATGANTTWGLVIGGVALALGAAFVLLARRRLRGRR